MALKTTRPLEMVIDKSSVGDFSESIRRNIDHCVCMFIVTTFLVVGTCPRCVRLLYCQFHNDCCVLLYTVSALRGNTVLTELSLRSCNIDADETSHLAQALCDITTLRVLNLSGNTVDSQGARHLGKLSGGVWAMGSLVTSDCQCAISNREMSIVQNMSWYL